VKVDLGKLIAQEALAYLRTGLLAGSGRSAIVERRSDDPCLGVFFVPGLGANPSQLAPIKAALAEEADWFDGFEYRVDRPLEDLAAELGDAIDHASGSCKRMLLIGHSLGGLLARMTLQSSSPPRAVAGFVSICAPLHGSWRARLAPHDSLRNLAPDRRLFADLASTSHRLRSLGDAVLTIGSRFDSFIAPFDSAFIDGWERLCLDDVGHVGSLFDERVHERVIALAKRIKHGGKE
jgi:pimeloyl-ACP methyl ester carboxylesterase